MNEQPETEVPHDPKTGEILEPDRRNEPWAASSMGQIIDMLERGQFSADTMNALKALGSGMTELAERTTKQQKGKLTLILSLKTEGEAFFIEAEFKVTAPKEPRPRTMAWQDDDGRFMPSMPKQKLLMGIPGTEHGPRIVSGGEQTIRTV